MHITVSHYVVSYNLGQTLIGSKSSRRYWTTTHFRD